MDESRTRRARKRSTAPTTPDPVEIAMAAAASDVRHDSPAQRLLLEHIELARDDRRHRRWQTVNERAGAALKLLTALTGIAVASALGVMVWSASQADGLVVSAFVVPPDLADRGLTGEVVANQVLDRLAVLNVESSITLRAANTHANDWSDGIDIDIPQTGISIGEFDRWLRGKLGRQTRLSGEVIRGADGSLTVTARTAGAASSTFTGPEADLDGLIAQSAEAVFAQTQPYRYAVALRRRGRIDDAAAIYTELAQTGPPTERAWGEVGRASTLANTSERAALDAYRRAVAHDPANALPFANLGMSARRLGRTEEALIAGEAAVRVLRGPNGSIRADAKETYRGRVGGLLAMMQGNLTLADQTYRSIAGREDVGASTPTPYYHAEALVRLHRPRDAQALIARTPNSNTRTAANINERNWIGRAEILMLADLERGEFLSVLAQRRDVLASLGDWPAATEHDRYRLQPLEAEALAQLGRLAEAELIAAGLPLDCEPCLRAKGRVAAMRGDRRAADRWFADAARQSRSTPFSRSAWGQARLARGDVRGAIQLFRQAHEIGRRWADPLKYWGDALIAQGDEGGAIRKYRAAAELAPRWGALHLAWGRALETQGRRVQAREKYLAAAGMDLNPADRAEVGRRLAASRAA